MISTLYAISAALLLFWLILQVIKQRRAHQISLGDGDSPALKNAIGAHGNAAENIPIFLILLFALEYNGAPVLLIHALGLAFSAGRLLHARGLLASEMKQRVLGMHLTLWPLLAVAACNLLYLPYAKLLG